MTKNTTNRIFLSPSVVAKLARVHKRAVWKTTTTREAVKNAAELLDVACDLLRLAVVRNEEAERKHAVLEQMKTEALTPSGLLEELETFVRRVQDDEEEKNERRRQSRTERRNAVASTEDGEVFEL